MEFARLNRRLEWKLVKVFSSQLPPRIFFGLSEFARLVDVSTDLIDMNYLNVKSKENFSQIKPLIKNFYWDLKVIAVKLFKDTFQVVFV